MFNTPPVSCVLKFSDKTFTSKATMCNVVYVVLFLTCAKVLTRIRFNLFMWNVCLRNTLYSCLLRLVCISLIVYALRNILIRFLILTDVANYTQSVKCLSYTMMIIWFNKKYASVHLIFFYVALNASGPCYVNILHNQTNVAIGM